jgi:hypothetical protein
MAKADMYGTRASTWSKSASASGVNPFGFRNYNQGSALEIQAEDDVKELIEKARNGGELTMGNMIYLDVECPTWRKYIDN